MREVMKWHKNKNGEIISKKVYKPDNGLIGRAKIKIFDSDGILKDEVYTENIIPNFELTHELYRTMYKSIANGGIYFPNDSSSYVCNSGNAFAGIVLSTYDGEEDPENLYFKGEVIGWCPRGSTSGTSDIKRGVYNSTESFSEYTEDNYYHAHLVYDFGTSQGNGSFNSIWWARSGNSPFDNPESPFVITGAYTSKPFNMNMQLYVGANNQVYTYKDNKYYTILNFDKYINGIESAKLAVNPVEFFHPQKYICGNEKVARYSNYKQSDGTRDTLKCSFDIEVRNSITNELLETIPINLRDSFADMDIFNETWAGCKIKLQSHSYNLCNGDVVLVFSVTSTYLGDSENTYKMYSWDWKKASLTNSKSNNDVSCIGVYNVISKSWSLVPSINNNSSRVADHRIVYDYGLRNNPSHNNSSDTTYYSSILSNVENIIETDGEYHIISNSNSNRDVTLNYGDFLPIKAFYSHYMVGGNGHGFKAFLPQYKNIAITKDIYRPSTSNTGATNVAYVIPGYSAHSKLPNTVTKTNADTMKIQYDYYIQLPLAFSKNDDYITLPE